MRPMPSPTATNKLTSTFGDRPAALVLPHADCPRGCGCGACAGRRQYRRTAGASGPDLDEVHLDRTPRPGRLRQSHRGRLRVGRGRHVGRVTPGALRLTGRLLSVPILLTALSACQGSSNGGNAPELVIVVSGTGNEPLPALSRRGEREVLAAARGDGHLTLIRAHGQGRAGGQGDAELLKDEDLTVRRRNGARENDAQARERGVAQRVKEVSALVGSVTAGAPGNDLLAGLEAAGRVPGRATVLVVGSGLQTVAPLDFRVLGWSFDPNRVVRDLAARRLLPRLTEKRVVFAGLGQVAGARQPALSRPDRRKLSELWCAIVSAAGGACEVDDELTVTAPPRARLPVPVVPITTMTTTRTPRGTQYAIPARLLFSRDSAALQPYADDVLRPIANRVRPGVIVDITGHTASWGPVPGRYALSKDRARAVADRLQVLGVPRTAIGRVEGVGSDHLTVPDLDASGRLIERAAERNRVVDLVLRPTA
jgi:outer membrane protein OmpA-like peptidoglycan-associated protein